MAEWTAEERKQVQRELAKPLAPGCLAERDGPGGQKLMYIEGWRQINIANDIFGFDKWSTEVVVSLTRAHFFRPCVDVAVAWEKGERLHAQDLESCNAHPKDSLLPFTF